MQAYSTTPTCAWSPAAAGDYLLSVTVKDGITGTEVNQVIWYTVLPNVTFSLGTSPQSPQPVNTAITLTGNAAGVTNPQYQFWLYTPNTSPAWSQLQAYATTPSCTWTPAATGVYLISATVRDGATGAEINQTLWYNIIPVMTLTLTTTPASPQSINTPITLNAQLTGGSNVQYQFWLYNPNTTPAWSELQAYASSGSVQWTPTTAGPYLISATALDGATGVEINQTLWFIVQ